MKNLRPSSKNAYETHCGVVASKTDRELVSRLSFLNDIIREKYDLYESHFTNNTLEELTPLIIDDAQKDDLLKLYFFKSKIIQEIKKSITTTDTNRVINTCQNCTINSISSLDHYLPKTDFLEFIVNPKNLFPSCSECNSYKGVFWIANNKRLFLNLYLDLLPREQYLFAEIVDGGMEITFSLRNDAGIETELFEIIESHYKRLYLLKRFRESSSEVVAELYNMISSLAGQLTIESIVETIITSEERTKETLGSNYWKSILKIALVNNAGFLARVIG